MLYNDEDLKAICATKEEVLKAVEVLIEGSLNFELNMSDTFGFACADSELLREDDFYYMIPIIAKFGRHALTAYVAVKRSFEEKTNIVPITCKCCHDGLEYKEARQAIEELFKDNCYFMCNIDHSRWDEENKDLIKRISGK